MTCTACGARFPKGSKTCALCGWRSEGEPEWDRSVEAAAFDGLRAGIEGDEQLLGFTRGRLIGGLKLGKSFGPRAMLAVAVNVGLLDDRMLIQPVDSKGRPLADMPSSIPNSEIQCITAADADPLEADRATRLTIQQKKDGGLIRIRTAGRLADGAREIAALWNALFCSAEDELKCPACGKQMDEPHRFCPFCGAGQQP